MDALAGDIGFALFATKLYEAAGIDLLIRAARTAIIVREVNV